jgi:hypothetical protein
VPKDGAGLPRSRGRRIRARRTSITTEWARLGKPVPLRTNCRGTTYFPRKPEIARVNSIGFSRWGKWPQRSIISGREPAMAL